MADITTTDRRGFLKGAVAAGAVATAGCALASTNAGTAEAEEAKAEETAGEELPVAGYVCAEDWLGQAPAIDPSQIVETIDADVVVCGGGHAGVQ